jgi:sulfur-carrier protein
MRVQVLFFGVLREQFQDQTTIELPDGSSVGALLNRVSLLRPGQKQILDSLAVAVNRDYAKADRILCDGDEVALLPPVSGGAR